MINRVTPKTSYPNLNYILKILPKHIINFSQKPNKKKKDHILKIRGVNKLNKLENDAN